MANEEYRHLLENKYIFDLPKSLERKDNMSDMFNMMNVFAIVIFIKLVFIGMVVAQSLIHNLIQSL